MAARPDDPADTDCEQMAPVELMMENRAESRPYPTYSSPPCPETVVFITPDPDVGYEHSKIGVSRLRKNNRAIVSSQNF